MDINTITQLFHNALAWNTFLYTLQKSFSMLLSITLYSTLSSQEFTTWALITSYIYLALLWTDCGFRKSLPRYIPLFSTSLHSFIIHITITKLIILSLSIISAFFYAPLLLPSTSMYYLPLILSLYAVEGLIDLIKLIFHSLFLHKIFNLISCCAFITQVSFSLLLIQFYPTNIITNLMIIWLICSSTILITLLFYLVKNTPTIRSATTNILPSFFRHSGIMWATTVSKSLSERNVLTAVLALTAGPVMTSHYKVANDIALFFQRVITKSIGVTDTVLLSSQPTTFTMIRSYISLSVMIASALSLITCASLWLYNYDTMVLCLFIILVMGYLTEIILSPYERVLEVKQEYRWIIGSYIPYYFLLILIGWYPNIHIIYMLGVLFISKIIGLMIMRLRAKRMLAK